MKNLGQYLKGARNKLGLSLIEVKAQTGITDSRLSKIENGQLNCPIDELRSLAILYQIPMVNLFLKAGYLIPEDLKAYQLVFQGVERLDEDEKNHIQDGINFLINKKD